MSSPSTDPCSVECGWLGASVGAGPGTWGSIQITYANGIILAPITLLRKSWNASVHLMNGKALVILGHQDHLPPFCPWCFPLNFKIAHDLIPLDVCCSEVSPHSLIESNQITCHSQPLLGLGSICECWHWNCCSRYCIWIRVRNSSSRLPQVVSKLLE